MTHFDSIHAADIQYVKSLDPDDQSIWDMDMPMESMCKYNYKYKGVPPTLLCYAIELYSMDVNRSNLEPIIQYLFDNTKFDKYKQNIMGINIFQEIRDNIECLQYQVQQILMRYSETEMEIIKNTAILQHIRSKILFLQSFLPRK